MLTVYLMGWAEVNCFLSHYLCRETSIKKASGPRGFQHPSKVVLCADTFYLVQTGLNDSQLKAVICA